MPGGPEGTTPVSGGGPASAAGSRRWRWRRIVRQSDRSRPDRDQHANSSQRRKTIQHVVLAPLIVSIPHGICPVESLMGPSVQTVNGAPTVHARFPTTERFNALRTPADNGGIIAHKQTSRAPRLNSRQFWQRNSSRPARPSHPRSLQFKARCRGRIPVADSLLRGRLPDRRLQPARRSTGSEIRANVIGHPLRFNKSPLPPSAASGMHAPTSGEGHPQSRPG